MREFPVTIIDNFFDDPDTIREFALKQDFKVNGEQYPGSRTDELLDLDINLFLNITRRLMSVFTDKKFSADIDIRFQKVESDWKEGWIHDDHDKYTFILYLDKNPPKNSGTSFFETKPNANYPEFPIQKSRAIRDNDYESFTEYGKKVNENFVESISVQAKYNRLVLFDGNINHAAQGFDSSEGDRLTMIGFIHELDMESTPLTRMRKIGTPVTENQ